MFLRMLMCVLAAVVLAIPAFAGPGTGGRAPLAPFFKAVAKKTGKSQEFVTNEALRSLLAKRKITEKEAEEITLGEKGILSAERQRELVVELQKSKRFKLNTGLEALRVQALADSGKITAEALYDQQRATKVRMAKTNAEISLAHYEAALLKFKANLDATKTASIQQELSKAGAEYYHGKLRLLTTLGIPFVEAVTNSPTTVPYNRLSKPLIIAIGENPQFARVLKNKPKLIIAATTAQGKSLYLEGTNELYLSLDILTQLN